MDLEKVSLAVDALAADHTRQGGHLDLDDFLRVISRRSLSPTEAQLISDELRLRGISIDDSSPVPAQIPIAGVAKKGKGGSRRDDGFGHFLDCIGETSLLTPEAEVALGRKIRAAQGRILDVSSGTAALQDPIIKAGCEAVDKLVKSNLRLVVSIARHYWYPTSLEIDDLVQHGCLGLMRAAQRFDPELGNRFSTYATWWINQSIQRAIADEDRTIRIPVHAMEMLSKIKKMRRSLRRELRRTPTDREIAEQLNISPEKVRFLLDISRPLLSVDVPLNGDEEGARLSDVLPSRCESALEGLIKSDRSDAIMTVLKTLTPKQEVVIKLRFGLNGHDRETLQTVGNRFNVTRERIRQIEFKALKKLRLPSRRAVIQDFIPGEP